ncbi:hypothetical protein RCF98_12150 [Thiothrix lacustris]|uniref:HPt domain-containing protein n=1 Tax=Thiothrix lacustris TaxID=525917 RepID=A0ABY9MMX9_9GAMM|nr:hypothetical protein [Thiothrix lacustris]WML89722.1 hypothetical protein RCF98_12150 [Thiothrix lacustris]
MPTTQTSTMPLSNKLSQQQLSLFLRKALPELTKDYAALDAHLQDQQWAKAVQQAHKLLSTIKLLGLDTLLPLLLQIQEDTPESRTDTFRQTLHNTSQQQLTALAALAPPPR